MATDPSTPPPLKEQEILTNTQISIWSIFKHQVPNFVVTMLIDIIIPFILYFVLIQYMRNAYALVIAGVPPILAVIMKATLSRTFDILGFLVFLTFIMSAIVAILTRNALIILLEISLFTVFFSISFASSLIPSCFCPQRCQLRSLAYYFHLELLPTTRAQVGLPESAFTDELHSKYEYGSLIPKLSNNEEVAQVYDWIYTHCSSFRLSCFLITLICSIGFFMESLARLILILLNLSANKIFLYGNIILIVLICLVFFLTLICVTNERKQTLIIIEQWKIEHLKDVQ